MATNEKKIKIVVDAKGAQRASSALQSQLGKLGLKVDGLDSSMKGMGGTATVVAGSVAAAGIAAVTAAAHLYTLVGSQTAVISNMAVLAGQANMNVESFQALAYAGLAVNKNQEDMAKIIQDTNDRIGELTGEGVGELSYAFNKFLKPAGLTIEKLKEMGGQDVLIAVTKAMQDGGASGAELTTVLEMIASDASHLKPLLIDNGKALKEMSREAENMGVIISKEQIDQARQFDIEVKKVNAQVDSMKNLFAIGMTPTMSAFNRVIQQTNKDLDYLFGLTDESKAEKLQKELNEISEAIGKQFNSDKKYGGGGVGGIIDALNPFAKKGDIEFLKKQSAEVFAELQAVYDRIEERKKRLSDSGGGNINGTGGSNTDTGYKPPTNTVEAQKEAATAYIEVIAQRNMDEFALLDAKQATETEKLNEFREIGAISDAEHKAAMLELEQSYADQVYAIIEAEDQKEADLAAKKKDREKKDAQDKAKTELHWQKQISTTNKDMARESLSLIASTAKEGSAIRVAALIAEKALAISQVITQYEVASAMAMAQLGPIAGAPVAATMRAQAIASSAIIAAQGAVEMSRQSGGYMQANTPYQVGGGAHTDTPEMYQSGGKSYIVDSQAGMMKRVSGNATSGGVPRVSMTINNSGEPMNLQQQSATMDENGVLNLIYENVPQILRDQAGNDQSDFSKAFGSIRNQDWSFT